MCHVRTLCVQDSPDGSPHTQALELINMTIIYLKKSSNDLLSHCKCEDALISYTAQLDCPWCGCGWLFSCIQCRKAFSFAEAVELDMSWEEIAQLDIYKHSKEKASSGDISDWVEDMEWMLQDIEIGTKYSILDGVVIPVESGAFEYKGWNSKHKFESNPHIAAINDDQVIQTKFSNREYWESNKV